jgi:hypothetical protein
VVAEGDAGTLDGDGLSVAEPHAARKRATPPNAAARNSSRREMTGLLTPASSHETLLKGFAASGTPVKAART